MYPFTAGALTLWDRKYEQGFINYQANTGQVYPLDTIPVGNLTRRATGANALTDDNNGELWHGSISVGTPAQVYTVDFDTGSSDLFLPSTSCTSNCKGHKLYNPTASSTSIDRRKTFYLQYGDGSYVRGQQYTETVSVAGLTVS